MAATDTPFTRSSPPSTTLRSWVRGEEPRYDPKVHLALDAPEWFVLLDWDKGTLTEVRGGAKGGMLAPPPPLPGKRSNLAYTAPFQFLSEEGVRALRQVLEDNMKHVRKDEVGRIPLSLRGMGYRSQFVRDLNTCPIANAFLSRLAGVEVVPHVYETSWGHTNIGVVGDTRAVDSWHIDSVNFVCVILLSDMTGASGGELEVVKRASFDEAFQLIRDTKNNVPEKDLLRVAYKGPGCAIFMQGSNFVHHVTPVRNAKGPRISFVNSYQPRDPDYPDDTRLSVFKNEPETCYYEFARHRAARAKSALDRLLLREGWESDPAKLAAELKTVAAQLADAVDVIQGKRDDGVAYYKEEGEGAPKARM